MKISSYLTHLNENGNPYLVKDREYVCDGRKRYDSPYVVSEFIKDSLSLDKLSEENSYILCLDSHNHLIGLFLIGVGTVTSCPFPVRETIMKSLLLGAVGIIMTHNHPSNDPFPSQTDVDTTENINKACETVGIKLLDHIIVTRSGGDYAFSAKTII